MAEDTAGSAGQGPIKSRADAYQRLNEVSEYLIRTEPHSPVPYLIKRAVAWGGMSFGELLIELVEGGGDHQRVLRLLGLDTVGKKPTDPQ